MLHVGVKILFTSILMVNHGWLYYTFETKCNKGITNVTTNVILKLPLSSLDGFSDSINFWYATYKKWFDN